VGSCEKWEQSAACTSSSVWVGAQVELCGLTRAASLNGRIGLCTDVDNTTGRLMVLLTDDADDDGKNIKVKQHNVRTASVATAARAVRRTFGANEAHRTALCSSRGDIPSGKRFQLIRQHALGAGGSGPGGLQPASECCGVFAGTGARGGAASGHTALPQSPAQRAGARRAAWRGRHSATARP
jgi:hypothetical protein